MGSSSDVRLSTISCNAASIESMIVMYSRVEVA